MSRARRCVHGNARGRVRTAKRARLSCSSARRICAGNVSARMGEKISIPGYMDGYVFGRVITRTIVSGRLEEFFLRATRLRIDFRELGERYRLGAG